MTTATATRTPAAPSAGRRDRHIFAGTGSLVRFALRRDRVRIPIWVAGILGLTVSTAASFPDLYPTAADRQLRADLMTANPGAIAMSGPGHGLDDYTFGAMMTNEMLGFTAILVALMSVLLVVRHTRAEEESGRAELVRATVVGRHASTSAALITVGGTNVVLGVLMALGLGSLGVETITWSGSLLFSAALASVGLVFTAFAAFTAQITEHARAASGMAGALIGVAYALRAAGDMGNGVASWLSPIGWAQATRAYVGGRWWPVALAVVVAVVFALLAYTASARRDLGAGIIQQRPGSATASAALGTPFGFAYRLQRSSLMWWGASMFVFGSVYGSFIPEVENFAEESTAVKDFIPEVDGATLTDSYIGLLASMFAMIVSVYAIQAILRLRTEETTGRAEATLGTALSRTRWVASHLAFALVGSVIVLLLTAVGLGISAGIAGDDMSIIGTTVGAALPLIPALWVTAGLALALFGGAPRAATLAWAVLVYALFVGVFGSLLQLPDWAFNLSPFAHVPALPAEELSWTPLLILTAVAAGLIAVGITGFRRRDLYTT